MTTTNPRRLGALALMAAIAIGACSSGGGTSAAPTSGCASTMNPVAGLVSPKVFMDSLEDRIFLATQYMRHHSRPLYTPEPDIVHEIIGHANALASAGFADLYEAAGRASLRAESDEALELFSRVFWFTLEFGVVREGADLKAYGAGLLSSYGEIEEFHRAELRPWDLAQMGRLSYDITRYQPVLFVAESFGRMVDELGEFFDGFDEEAYRRWP